MKVNRFFHYGVVVPNLDNAVVFFEEIFGIKQVQLRKIEDEYLALLVGSKKTSARIAMLELGENAFLEILEWKSEENSDLFEQQRSREQETLTDIGTQHLCLFVDDAAEIFEVLSGNLFSEMISPHPIEIPFGPNKGALVFFVKIFGVLYLEIFQKSAKVGITLDS